MARKIFLNTVNDRVYKIEAKSAVELLSFSPKAVNLIGKALDGSPFIANFDPAKLTEDNAVAALLPEFLRIAATLPPAEVTHLLKCVFQSPIYIENGDDLSDPDKFEDHFDTYPEDLMQVAMWSILQNATIVLLKDAVEFLPTLSQDD